MSRVREAARQGLVSWQWRDPPDRFHQHEPPGFSQMTEPLAFND
jgi:hypothetical protein